MFHSVITVNLCPAVHSNLLQYVQVKQYREATCTLITGKVQQTMQNGTHFVDAQCLTNTRPVISVQLPIS